MDTKQSEAVEAFRAIEWPKVVIGGVEYTLRLSYPAHAQLFAWGFQGVPNIPVAAWAAAMAGEFRPNGKWRSAGFSRWQDVADMIEPEQGAAIASAVEEAIKKASPEATLTVQVDPAKATPALN